MSIGGIDVIICPKCGNDTVVKETRSAPGTNYIRRRRICMKVVCSARFTTLEVAIDDANDRRYEDVVLVPRRDLEAILRITKASL